MEIYGFGLGDYIFLIPIGLLIIIFGIASFSNENAMGEVIYLLIMYFILSLPVLYYFHMPDGQYKAKITEAYDMKIGEGTKGSEEFEVMKKDNKFIINLNKYSEVQYELINEKKWYNGLYVKTYRDKLGYNYLTLTCFGYVMLHKKEGDIYTKIKVFY